MSSLNENFKIKNGLTVNTTISAGSCIEGDAFKKHGGTSSQFLKADGSVDSATYTTCTGTVVAGDIANHDQSACAGLNCTGTTTASNTQTFTNKSGNISQWTNDSGYTTCTGTVVAGDIANHDQSACAGLNCVGDITAVTTGPYLTGGATSGSAEVGIDSACAAKWDTAAAGDISEVVAGTNLTGGGTSGSVTLNMATGGAGAGTYGDTNNGQKIDTITLDAYGRVTAVACGPTGDIQGICTNSGSLLSGGIGTGTACIGIDSGALDYLNQSACAGLDCVGTTTASNSQTFTNKAGNISQWTNDSGYTTCTGTLVAGDLTACDSKFDQSGCAGINCVGTVVASDISSFTSCLGDITGVTAGLLLSGGGSSGSVTLGLDSGALDGLDQSACAGIDCTGTMTSVGVSDGLESTGGNSPTLGIATACNTKWDQSGCAGLNCVGTVVAGDISGFTDCLGDITAVCAGTLLSGGAVSGDATIGINSGALDYLNQSACPGIDCVGTVVAGDISSFTSCTGTTTPSNTQTFTNKSGNISQWTNDSGYTTCVGTVVASDLTGLDQSSCAGILCTGTMTSVGVSDGLETTGGNAPTLGIATACNTKWDQSGCAGINCVGTVVASDISSFTSCLGDITAVTTSTDYMTGGGASGDVEVGIDSACTAKWDAGGGISSGTACKLTKYNAAGTDIEDSIATESSSLITIAGALDVDNICSNDASNNIKYGLNVGGGGIANTSIGCCAANAMSTGFNNVAIGPASMKAANGVCCNVALGVNAAEDLTVGGDDNVAIGTFAMTNGTTTTDSIAIGKCAMGVGVTTGACNVAIGFETMKNTTSGCNNTALGSFSMAANATGEFNTSIGFKALCSIVGGDRNVAIGNTAGKSITSGNDNVAIGHNALCSSLNGCYNVAIGRRAMIAVTTGNDNVAIGQDALSDTTSGCCNVALGLQSMDGNTTGSYNVSIGQQAMFYALSGDHNLAMGQYALYDNWGGDYNTAVGTAAMQCNTTGSNNAALGYRAMMNNTTGNDNFAVGECALQSNVNGIGNTALGHNAFGSSVTGNYSVAIGDNAGTYFANGCTTLSAASDSIYIGRNTRGKDNNDSNSIVIGYNACSCGANTIKLGSNSITAACIQVAWTAVSDERDKTDITDLNHGLEFIGDLKPKAFKYRKTRTSSANDGVCRYGFLAQDIQETEDGDKVIVSESNPEQLGLNSDYLVPILVKGMQEQQAMIADLKQRLEVLEG